MAAGDGGLRTIAGMPVPGRQLRGGRERWRKSREGGREQHHTCRSYVGGSGEATKEERKEGPENNLPQGGCGHMGFDITVLDGTLVVH